MDLFGMCRAQPELDTVMADAPEEVSVVSVDVDEAWEASDSTVLALSSNYLALQDREPFIRQHL